MEEGKLNDIKWKEKYGNSFYLIWRDSQQLLGFSSHCFHNKRNQDLYLTDSGTSAYKQLVSVQNNKIVADT